MDYASMADEELMARFYAGDNRAFSELHNRHVGRLIAYTILLPTPNCPPLPRLAEGSLRDDWTPEEQSHFATKCAYCEKTIALARRLDQAKGRDGSPSVPAVEGPPTGIEAAIRLPAPPP